ncbi:MAG: glycosyltransferase family 4 protein [Thermoplasmata archaeon]|nr:glycosyltransferase family 4 protein [Thermoplasmata archaeon]
MRVVLVGSGVLPIPPPGYGGVERTIAEYAGALRDAGVEVRIVHQTRRGRSSDEYRFALRLPSLLRLAPDEIVHASTPVVANRLRWSGIPYVYTTHSRHWFQRDDWHGRWGYFLERRAVQGAAAVVALTSALRDQIRSSVPRARSPTLEVIPIGVDLAKFAPSWDERRGNVALGVGVVAPIKRWELAAAALKGTGWRFVLAGPMPDPAYAERVRRAGDRVELVGEIPEDELVRRFAAADLLVHPSSVEVLAGAVVQAMASGLPVLGAPPIRRLLQDGVTGWTSATDEPGAIVETIRRHAGALVGDLPALRRLGESARDAAEHTYAWPSIVAAHLRLYDRVQRVNR